MPSVGKEYNFTPFSVSEESEVQAAIRISRNASVEMLFTMFMGDDVWFGSKRAVFRLVELMVLATDPASMTVRLTQGSAMVNDGANHTAGNWYHIYAGEDARSVVIDAPTSPSLTRYDIVCIAPKRTAVGTVERRIIGESGNISLFTDVEAYVDDFDLYVYKGDNGAAKPSTNRNTAHQLVPAGLVPIAIVRVQGGATEITNADIDDLRELMIPRALPISEEFVPPEMSDQLGGLLVPAVAGQPYVLRDGGDVALIPKGSLFEDQNTTPALLKYKRYDGTIKTITVS